MLSVIFLAKGVVILFLLGKNNFAVQHTAFKAENYNYGVDDEER